MNNAQDVKLLSLVFVYALDLNIEKCIRIDFDSSRTEDVLRQSYLVRMFNVLPLLLEVFIVHIVFELVQQRQVGEKIIPTNL